MIAKKINDNTFELYETQVIKTSDGEVELPVLVDTVFKSDLEANAENTSAKLNEINLRLKLINSTEQF